MKSTAMAMAAFLVLGVASSAAAQEHEAQAAAEQKRRYAQPRERAPRNEAPPPAAATPPPQAERATPRSRGVDDAGRVRAPRDSGRVERNDPRERPVDRADSAPVRTPRVDRRREPDPVVAAPAPPAAAAAAASSAGSDEQRTAVPRGSRPRGDNPAVGRAEPRDGRSYPVDGGRSYPGSWGGSRVYTSRGRYYNNYYYYPRRWYPYGYGAFGGLGYFYYDPYTWYAYDPYWSRPHPYYYGSHAHNPGGYYYETGELRLQVHPRQAEVYVDGYFAGRVDDFDGMFQALRLEEGPYKIEIIAPGYEPLVFDIRILPGRKISYRGELRPRP